MNFEKKNSLLFCKAENSASIDISIDCVGWTVRPFGSLPQTPFFTFSVNNSLSMKKMEKSSGQLSHFIFDSTVVWNFSSQSNE